MSKNKKKHKETIKDEWGGLVPINEREKSETPNIEKKEMVPVQYLVVGSISETHLAGTLEQYSKQGWKFAAMLGAYTNTYKILLERENKEFVKP